MEGGEKKCLPNRLRDQSSFLIKLRADPQSAPKPQTPPEFAVCRVRAAPAGVGRQGRGLTRSLHPSHPACSTRQGSRPEM